MPVITRNQVNLLPFSVLPVHESAIISVNDGRLSGVRRFKVPWRNVEEFQFRVVGKFYRDTDITDEDAYLYPVLPAPYPTSDFEQMSLVATSAKVMMDKSDICGFNNASYEEPSGGVSEINNIGNPITSLIPVEEKYFFRTDSVQPELYATVEVNYTEAEWDVTSETVFSLLVNTGVRLEINPSYETFTIPSRDLIFSDLPPSIDRTLKDDSHGYMIIPKADVIVHWSNIPVSILCEIHGHLRKFSGKVNAEDWGDIVYYSFNGHPGSDALCSKFPAETLMFVDFEEDFSRRTFGFSQMNTTTLKLHFKSKAIAKLNNEGGVGEWFGWNHAPLDHSMAGSDNRWMRVKQVVGGTNVDLFELIDFEQILNPVIFPYQ